MFYSAVCGNKFLFGRCLEEASLLPGNMMIEMSLLDFLSYKTGCQIGDLPAVAKTTPNRILHVVFGIEACADSLDNWNDALNYLFGLPPAQSCEEARRQMVADLSSK